MHDLDRLLLLFLRVGVFPKGGLLLYGHALFGTQTRPERNSLWKGRLYIGGRLIGGDATGQGSADGEGTSRGRAGEATRQVRSEYPQRPRPSIWRRRARAARWSHNNARTAS